MRPLLEVRARPLNKTCSSAACAMVGALAYHWVSLSCLACLPAYCLQIRFWNVPRSSASENCRGGFPRGAAVATFFYPSKTPQANDSAFYLPMALHHTLAFLSPEFGGCSFPTKALAASSAQGNECPPRFPRLS
jgi:hypothetical protein